MKELLKKYGKYLTSFAGLSALMGMPLAVLADWRGNLDLFTGATDGIYSAGSGEDTLIIWIGSIISVIIGFLGVLLVLYIIWAGFLWMTDGGEGKKVQKAKDMIKQAVIGIIIVFAAYAITSFVMENLIKVTGTAG